MIGRGVQEMDALISRILAKKHRESPGNSDIFAHSVIHLNTH